MPRRRQGSQKSQQDPFKQRLIHYMFPKADYAIVEPRAPVALVTKPPAAANSSTSTSQLLSFLNQQLDAANEQIAQTKLLLSKEPKSG